MKTAFSSEQTVTAQQTVIQSKSITLSREKRMAGRPVLKPAKIFERNRGRTVKLSRTKLSQTLKLFCVLFFVSACFPQNGLNSSRSPTTVICNCGANDIVRGLGENRRAAESAAQEKCNLVGLGAVTKCKPVK